MTLAPIQLSPNLKHLLTWENEQVIERYGRNLGKTREESQSCFVAWKQFMAVSATRGTGNSVPSGPIDEMWHTALDFTRPYREFCAEYIGRFVDHNPQEHSDPGGYEATRQIAEGLFGELDSRYWTADGACCGIDCCKDGG